MKTLRIETTREAYSPEDIRRTMTVGELIRLLEDYDEDREIVLSFDNGYTFGGIKEGNIYAPYEEEEEEI